MLQKFLNSNIVHMSLLILSLFGMLQVYAIALQPSNEPTKIRRMSNNFYVNPSWTIKETFSIDIYLLNVEDVCAWQAEIIYDPYELVVLDVKPGGFLSLNNWVVNSTRLFYNSEAKNEGIPNEHAFHDYAVLIFATDIAPNELLVGGCRFDLLGVSGSGTVATVTFGVWSHANNNANVSVGKSLLLDSNLMETTKGSITIITP